MIKKTGLTIKKLIFFFFTSFAPSEMHVLSVLRWAIVALGMVKVLLNINNQSNVTDSNSIINNVMGLLEH